MLIPLRYMTTENCILRLLGIGKLYSIFVLRIYKERIFKNEKTQRVELCSVQTAFY